MSIYRTLIVSALMIITMVVVEKAGNVEEVRLKKSLSTFPKQIGKWVGTERRFDQQIYDILGVDESYLSDFKSPDGSKINLYIGFYKSQREGKLPHSPLNCMPGGGWNIVQSSIMSVPTLVINDGNFAVAKILLQKGAEKQVALYWYQSRGRVITSEYLQKIYLVVDSITRKRTDGSFVRLMAPMENGDAETALTYLRDFAGRLYPILQGYIPS